MKSKIKQSGLVETEKRIPGPPVNIQRTKKATKKDADSAMSCSRRRSLISSHIGLGSV